MKVFFFLLLTGGSVIGSLAQENSSGSAKKKLPEYFFQVQTGALVGCSSCSDGKQISFTASTTHGIKIGRKLRVGTGVGLDAYNNWNVVPYFGSISWDFPGKRNALFVHMNYGGTLASWRSFQWYDYGLKDSYMSGNFTYGIGYRLTYDKLRLSIGFGEKRQVLHSYYEYPTYYFDVQRNMYLPGTPSTKTVKTQMNRLAIWMAIGWK